MKEEMILDKDNMEFQWISFFNQVCIYYVYKGESFWASTLQKEIN